MICTRNCMYTVNGECGLKLTSSDATNRCPLMPDDAPESKPYKPPMTNAQKIRAMDDKELCEFLYSYKYCDMCEEGCGECSYHGDCERRLTDWLQQPCEGGADREN